MANPLPSPLATGTLGELLVQLRLLQFGIQAAPPLKDSGNDLVAFHGPVVRTLQVKCATNRIPRDRRLPNRYDILALVLLRRIADVVELDASRVFLIPSGEVAGTRRSIPSLVKFELRHDVPAQSMALLDWLFRGNGL